MRLAILIAKPLLVHRREPAAARVGGGLLLQADGATAAS
jgi:hypothetical protein